jgi:hypothetical protein
MMGMSVARNQRGALTQAGAGIAASRRKSVDFARLFLSLPIARRKSAISVRGGIIMRRLFTRVAAPMAMVALLSGCALAVRTPTVQELKYNPGRYHDRTVAIDGVVTSSWGLPLVPFKMYKVDDGTGEVTVLARGGRTPTRGAHVRVKGRVNEVATFGGSTVGLHIQETDLDFRR